MKIASNLPCDKKLKHIVFLRRLPNTVVWGGLEKLILEWFERVDYKTCRITLVVTPGWKSIFGKHFTEKKIPVEIIEFSFNFNSGFFSNFSNMYRFLKTLKPSTVIFVQGDFADFNLSDVLSGYLLTCNNVYMHENLGIPLPSQRISKYHLGIIPGLGLWWHIQRLLNSFRARFSRKILVVSQEIKYQLTECLCYPKHKVVVAYHGINLKKFSLSTDEREEMRQTLRIPHEGFVFIITSRLSEEKCIERSIEAFDLLAKQHNHAWLLILGDGNLRQELRQLAQQKVCKNRIFFLGYRDNVEKYLKAADCYVNSSDREGLSIALLEAMASGVICIATRCSGSVELIQNSQSGFLVEKSAAGVFQGMLKAVSLNAKGRQTLALQGIQFVSQHFDLNRSVKKTLETMRIPNIPAGGYDD